MRAVETPPLDDDLPIEPLLAAIATEIAHLQNTGNPAEFRFGPRVLTRAEYVAGLKRFIAIFRESSDRTEALRKVAAEFQFYEVNGRDGWGQAFVTSYYEPVLRGAMKQSARFSRPLYRRPEQPTEFTRAQIDSEGVLRGRGLELVWLDPIDAFFLHVQGSGTVELGDGKTMRVSYSATSGHRYEAISQFLREVIPADQMNLHTIEAHLRGLAPDQAQAILDKNPRYVFFEQVSAHAPTALGVPATDGRTIAADARLYPKGALAFLVSQKPRFEDARSLTPAGWEPLARFVLDQDVGGAITGGGRLDLFWGRGDEAKRSAGLMKHPGRLYYVAPR